MTAYYNELDPFAAAWLRELIKAGLIAPGEVDERSITDVQPEDLRRFIQCHFFAGIGVWSYALRAAGWADDSPVWTGSCPCQPFSAAGKRAGSGDQRHLWPAWFRLLRQCRPDTVFGEQVASKDGLAWLDLVSSDLEGEGYAFGAADTCAAGFGAPHIRQRLYFVAHAGCERQAQRRIIAEGMQQHREVGFWADTADSRRARARQHGGRPSSLPARPEQRLTAGELGHARTTRLAERECDGGVQREALEPSPRQAIERRGFTNGFWRDALWLPCRDGKARPVEPGTFPLAHGSPARMGRLRGYGNSLCAPQAEAFIEAYLEVLGGGGPGA